MTKTWFITGTSRGFGREWAIAALDRGDNVAATARTISSLDGLVASYGDAVLPITLDVTDRDAVNAAVTHAQERFGGIDIAVNNAGYGHFGMIEEVSEADARAQLDTNVLGALWVTQAVLPGMRKQGSGHILQVSSVGGLISFPPLGIYNASKWALEGLSEALAAEVAGFGIKVTIIEPGGYDTDWGGPSAEVSDELPAYATFRTKVAETIKAMTAANPLGNPTATRDAILKIVDADKPPLRLFLGDGMLSLVTANYESRLTTWREWEHVSKAAHGVAN